MKFPLTGKTVVVTRATEQAGTLLRSLEELGAHVVHIPTIEIVVPDSWQACDEAISHLGEYNWLIFTSSNGVRFFLRRLQEVGKEIADLEKVKIAAVGERTQSSLLDFGLSVDILPQEFRAEGLVKAFEKINISGRNVLIVRPQKTRNILAEHLEKRGAFVESVPVYKNQSVTKQDATLEGQYPDLLTFTSPSTFQNFVKLYGYDKVNDWCDAGTKIAAIGGVTSDAIHEFGLQAHIVPRKSTVESFVKAIVACYGSN